MTNSKKIQPVILTLLAAALALIPVFAKSNYIISVGVTFFIYASLGTSWNIIGGYAGQTCWCMASFVGIGAYTSFIMDVKLGIIPWVGMFVGMCLSAVLAYIIGSVCFRHRGVFFSLVTIGFTEIIRILLIYFKGLTGGSNGLYVTYRENSLAKLTFNSDKVFFYLMMAVTVIIIFVAWRIENSKLGYYLRAIRADEDATESLGIAAYKVKIQAFMISAVLASVVGTFFAYFLCYIDPPTVSALALSTKIGAMAIVGGIGTLFGPLIGAAVLIPMTEISSILLGQTGSGMLLYGAVMLLIVILRPGGVISLFRKKDNTQRMSKYFKKGGDSDADS